MLLAACLLLLWGHSAHAQLFPTATGWATLPFPMPAATTTWGIVQTHTSGGHIDTTQFSIARRCRSGCLAPTWAAP